jgi:hypothetical protein
MVEDLLLFLWFLPATLTQENKTVECTECMSIIKKQQVCTGIFTKMVQPITGNIKNLAKECLLL